VPADDVGGILFAYGLAGAGGLVIAGVFGDRYPRGALLVLLIGIVAAMVGLAVLAPGAPARVVVSTAFASARVTSP
jgi:predicted MFS family arabinose efflux permease